MWYSPGAWDTSDNHIPFGLFLLMEREMDMHLVPWEELHTANAVSLGTANAENGKDPKVKTAMRRLRRAAYPEDIR